MFGLTGWTIPPNSQGYITLAAAWVLERLGPPADPTDPAFHHAVIEAYRAFAWERNDVVADPDHLPWELSEYLAPERLEQRLHTVVPDAVADWPEPTPGPAGTAYFSAIDADGMAVSCIQSNYFGIGSRISAGSTGVFLHNRAAGFSVIAGHPNEAGPGKRPLHTLAPTLWTRGDESALILGTRGGDQQPQYLAQMVAAMLISLCLVVIEVPLSSLLGSYSQELDLVGFDPVFLGSLLLVGGSLGVAGAIVAASQRLKDLEIL